jgi:hypothetical protein
MQAASRASGGVKKIHEKDLAKGQGEVYLPEGWTKISSGRQRMAMIVCLPRSDPFG